MRHKRLCSDSQQPYRSNAASFLSSSKPARLTFWPDALPALLLLPIAMLASLSLSVPSHQLLPQLPPALLLLLLFISCILSLSPVWLPACTAPAAPPPRRPPPLRRSVRRQVASGKLPAGMPRLLLSLAHLSNRPPTPGTMTPTTCGSRCRCLLPAGRSGRWRHCSRPCARPAATQRLLGWVAAVVAHVRVSRNKLPRPHQAVFSPSIVVACPAQGPLVARMPALVEQISLCIVTSEFWKDRHAR